MKILNEYKTNEQIVFFFIFETQIGKNVQWVAGLSFKREREWLLSRFSSVQTVSSLRAKK